MGSANLFAWSRLTVVCAILAGLLAAPCLAWADRPPPLSSQTLKGPSGPTSLKGLGESFSANAATGTGSYSIPIELPPGFVAPKIHLNYTGGTGRSEVGVGFSLPILQIYRQTDKGAPKFTEADRFAVTGAEYNDELVAVDSSRKLFRLKNEGPFLLFERDAANDRWIVRQPNGSVSYLGQTQIGRGQSLGRTTRWYVERTQDVLGHVVAYRYLRDNGRVYLTGVDYQIEATANYRNRVDFEYETRSDVTRDYTYGDEVSTSLRIRAISVSQGTRLLRRYTLNYDNEAIWSLLTKVEMEGELGLKLPTLKLEYLKQSNRSGRFVRAEGFRSLTGLDTGRMTLEDINGDALPDLLDGTSTNYAYYENVDGVRFANSPTQLGVSGSPDRDLDAAGVVLADVDGDGFRDVWHPVGNQFRYYPGGNIRNGRFNGFGAMQLMNANSVVTDVTTTDIRLTDLNGDGRIDLLRQRIGTSDVWVENGATAGFVQTTIPTLPAGVRLDDSQVELSDFNGDGVLDLIKRQFEQSDHFFRIWYGLGSGKYRSTEVTWAAPQAFANEVHLTDVNRDGQLDFVRVSGSWVGYWLNDGRGSFAIQHGDFRGMPSMSRTTKLLFADMNGNGTSDVVWITSDGGMSYLDLMEEPNVGLLSRVDNGMGMVTDISYRSSTDYAIDAKLRGEPWKLPMPHPVPVIAEVRVRDSLELLGMEGWQSRTSYDYADGYYDGKEREFRGFARVTTTNWGDTYQEGKLTELRMHVGRNLETGDDEESLKGRLWLQAEKTDTGSILRSEEAKWEQRWLCQEDLGSGAAVVLPSCSGISNKSDHRDVLVSLGVQTGLLRGSWEKEASPRYSAKKMDYDAWGKQTRVEEYGEVSLAAGHQLGQAWSLGELGVSLGNDERLEEFDYANRVDLGAGIWFIGFPVEERVKTPASEVASRTQVYYDGPALTGLALGQLTQGLVSRRVSWLAEESRWVPVERISYNSDGLPTQRVDATGHAVTFVYDQASRLHVQEERWPLEANRSAVYSGTYDFGYGVVTSVTDPNGKTTTYQYDGLGRISKVIDPLGSVDEPLIGYNYAYGDPVSTTTVMQLAERGRGVYRMSLVYTDGLGRARLTKQQNEQGFIGSGLQWYSAAGAIARVSSPFASAYGMFEAAAFGTPETVSYSDALGRPLRVYLPVTPESGASYRAYAYRPFEVRRYGEKDSTEGSLAYPEIVRVDGLGRLREVEKTNLVGSTAMSLLWKFGFDVRGNLTTLTDPKQFGRTYGYDSLGRLRSLSDPNLGVLQYNYDDAARMTKRVDGLGQEVVSEYGPSGRMQRMAAQARDSQTGNMRVDFEYLYHYDEAKADGPLPAATNLVGRLSWVAYPVGADHYSYDERGQVTAEAALVWDGVSPLTAQVRTSHLETLAYNAAGQLTNRGLPGGFTSTANYDMRGQLTRLNGGLPQDTRDIVSLAIYDQRGMAKQIDLGNGLRDCRTYNARGQLSGIVLGNASDVTCSATDSDRTPSGIYHLFYGWALDATLTTVTDRSAFRAEWARLDAAFEYDRLLQLVAATTTVGNWEFAYDSIQNLTSVRKQQGASVATQSLVYGEAAGPNAVTHLGTTSLAYDGLGQLKQYNGYDLKFDALGQLTQASKSGGQSLQYYYDAFGERRLLILTQSGGLKEIYRYPFAGYEERQGDSFWRIDEQLGPQAEIRRAVGLRIDATLLDELTQYVNAPQGKPNPLPVEWLDLDGDGDGFDASDLAVARQAFWAGKPAGASRTEWRYIQRDHLSSSVLVTDRSGNLVSGRWYEPYGAMSQRKGLQPTSGYAGAEVEPDEDLGLIHMGMRYYAPLLSRWITPDRYIGESPKRMLEHLSQSNLFSYGQNSPTLFVDPSGALVSFADKAIEKKWQEAKAYLANAGGDKYLTDLETRTDITVVVKATTGDSHFAQPDSVVTGKSNSKEKPVLEWNPNEGVDVVSGKTGKPLVPTQTMSPSLVLLHEVGHAIGYAADPHKFLRDSHPMFGRDLQYGSKEEKRVIESIEVPAAQKLQEPVRDNHGGATRRVPNVTTHTRVVPAAPQRGTAAKTCAKKKCP